jgi:hypothetical protein
MSKSWLEQLIKDDQMNQGQPYSYDVLRLQLIIIGLLIAFIVFCFWVLA